MIVDQAIYRAGHREECSDIGAALHQVRAQEDASSFLWIGLKDPTDEEFTEVERTLDLHPLAVEDAIHGDQRAKIEQYDATLFAVLKTLRYVEATSDIETGEVMCFLGPGFVVTVRRGEAAPLAGVRRRLEARPELTQRDGPQAVFHAVIDAIVDTYRVIDDEVQYDLEQIEQSVFSSAEVARSETIYRLKREVMEFQRAARPLVRPVTWLTAEDGPIEDQELRHQFRDVHDHLTDVVDHVISYDALLTDVLNAHLAQVGVQQNDDMRKISAWVAIAAVPTLLAGIFGMNFSYMPGLDWRYGYPTLLVGMAGLCLVLFRAFKRSGWL